MPVKIRVIDYRIGGSFKSPRKTDIPIGDGDDLDDIVRQIIKAAGGKKIENLGLYCHGIGRMIYQDCTLVCAAHGGYGLQLGSDDVTFGTVTKLAPLAGRFTPGAVMDICACAAADVGAEDGKMSGDGIKLMFEIAANAGVIVRASGSIQKYHSDENSFLGMRTPDANVDFGDWEGTVWLFDPKTQKKSKDRANSNP